MNIHKEISLLTTLGVVLLVGGLATGIYFLTSFDTSVAIPQTELFGRTIGGGRVNNIGLMSDRQNGIDLGFGASVVGLAILIFQQYNKKQISVENIKSEFENKKEGYRLTQGRKFFIGLIILLSILAIVWVVRINNASNELSNSIQF